MSSGTKTKAAIIIINNLLLSICRRSIKIFFNICTCTMLKLSRLRQHNHQKKICYSGGKKTELTTDNRQNKLERRVHIQETAMTTKIKFFDTF